MKFLNDLLKKAKNNPKTIVFPEAGFSDRIVKAVKKIQKKGVAKVVLIGDESSLVLQDKALKNFNIVNPKTCEYKNAFAEELYNLRKEKGMTKEQAEELVLDPFYFSAMYVRMGYADGMVGGAEVSTAKMLKPALQLLRNSDDFVNSFFVMCGKNKMTDDVFFLADCGLIEQPTAEQLSVIAERAVNQSNILTDNEAKVAFLSYSTLGSAKSESTQKMRTAYELFAEKNPNTKAIGEIQLDAALIESVAKTKLKQMEFPGSANILIYPDINAANICYKAISYFGGLYALGPITTGLTKPANDLSRGATVDDIVYVTALTVLQCQNNKE